MFLEAVGYPERAPDGAASFTMQVDGGEIVVWEDAGGAIRLMHSLSAGESDLPRLAEYAAGRMLREEARLAFGQSPVSAPQAPQPRPSAFLWVGLPAGADGSALRRSFEEFADSCDWWRARVATNGEAVEAAPFPEMVIRP